MIGEFSLSNINATISKENLTMYDKYFSKLTLPETYMTMRNGNYKEWNPVIEKVIFNPPATIVFWKGGGKTVVKCNEPDKFDGAKGVALCYMKMALGNTSRELNKALRNAGVYYSEETETEDKRYSLRDAATAFLSKMKELKEKNLSEKDIAQKMGFDRVVSFRIERALAIDIVNNRYNNKNKESDN